MVVAALNPGVDARSFRRKCYRRFQWIRSIVSHSAREVAKESRHLDQAIVLHFEGDKAVGLVKVVCAGFTSLDRHAVYQKPFFERPVNRVGAAAVECDQRKHGNAYPKNCSFHFLCLLKNKLKYSGRL